MKTIFTSCMVCIGVLSFSQAGKNTESQIGSKTIKASFVKKNSLPTITWECFLPAAKILKCDSKNTNKQN